MKKIIMLMAGVLLMTTACQDLTELNIDPNRPTETHPQLLLTGVQWEAFQAYQGTGPLYGIKMLVQTDGENSEQYYKWSRGEFKAYSRMRDVVKMMEEGERVGDKTYVALGKFFKAYYFYHLTLDFGDIPYSEALKGESGEGYKPPVYDAQKQVFIGILKELKEANEILAAENKIIAGDIIYKGDIMKWRKLINAYRLKVLLTLSKKMDDADLAVKASFAQIVQQEPLLSGNADDGQLVFLDQQDNRYPEFNSSSFGSGMYIDSTFIRRLQDRQDPRLFLYCTQTRVGKDAGKAISDFSSYEGGDPAAPYAQVNAKAVAGRTSKVHDRFTKDPVNEPMVLMGYAEQQLTIAEAIVRGWVTGDATAYYNQGVKSSFAFYEAYARGLGQYVTQDKADAYLKNDLNDLTKATTPEAKIERIVMQRYLRSFFQSGWSSFFDHLRTGYPEFRRPAGVAIPFRWMYPQDEYNVNTENVAAAIKSQYGDNNDVISAKPWWVR